MNRVLAALLVLALAGCSSGPSVRWAPTAEGTWVVETFHGSGVTTWVVDGLDANCPPGKRVPGTAIFHGGQSAVGSRTAHVVAAPTTWPPIWWGPGW